MLSLFLIPFLIYLSALVDGAEINASACLENGFTSNLKCTSCDSIAKVLNNKKLDKSCQSCCTKNQKTNQSYYKKFVLEVDRRFLLMYPEIEKVVSLTKAKKKKEPWKTLVVNYEFGARPVLHLYTEIGDELPEESISVQSWKSDVIEEFLKDSIE